MATQQLLKGSFEKIQNVIGVLFLIGNIAWLVSLGSEIFTQWFYGVDYEQFAFIGGVNPFLFYMLVTSFVGVVLNLLRSMRIKKIIVVIAILTFLPMFIDMLMDTERYIHSAIFLGKMMLLGLLWYALIAVYFQSKPRS